MQPLPANAPPMSYQELHARAKEQTAAAQEFFYRDSWREVEQAALSLQQTAALMSQLKPEAIPAKQKETLAKHTKELTDAAATLGEAGKTQDVARTTEAFQKLNVTLREMRPE